MNRTLPFWLAAIAAAPALLMLAAAAPGGSSWRWLEIPVRVAPIALLLGLWGSRAQSLDRALVPLVGTPAIHTAWSFVAEWFKLAKLERTELFGSELGLLLDHSLAALAPWLIGALYAALAALAIRARGRDSIAPALWLASVGGVAIALTLLNPSWLTLDNLSRSGTYRSSAAWPDTKLLSLVVAAATLLFGAGAAIRARSIRR